MQVLDMFFYLLAGFLLAIPYCWLAGWSTEAYLFVAFVAPAFLFIWFMLAGLAGIFWGPRSGRIHLDWRAAFSKSGHRLEGSLFLFWAWTIYCFLPIIFHWSAVLLGKIGHETAGSFLETHRYTSTYYAFMATITLVLLMMLTGSAWYAVKNTWKRFVRR